jgi:hypothetical protein
MDWNKLQHTLFEMDPIDPREDIAKLQAQAQGGNSGAPAADTVDYLNESAEVPQGSLEIDRDYSVSDFAALAGIKLNESQKTGSAGQLKGKDAIKKNPAGTTENPTRDKLVGEGDDDKLSWRDAIKRGWDNHNSLSAVGLSPTDKIKKIFDPKKTNTSADSSAKSTSSTTSISDLSKGDSFKDSNGMVWYYNPNEKNWRSKDRKQTLPVQRGFRLWQQSQSNRKRSVKEEQIEALESRVAYLESVIETLLESKTPKKPATPNPVAKHMNTYNKASVVPDKKKDAKAGKQKHKGQQYESIKDELWARLNELGKS